MCVCVHIVLLCPVTHTYTHTHTPKSTTVGVVPGFRPPPLEWVVGPADAMGGRDDGDRDKGGKAAAGGVRVRD